MCDHINHMELPFRFTWGTKVEGTGLSLKAAVKIRSCEIHQINLHLPSIHQSSMSFIHKFGFNVRINKQGTPNRSLTRDLIGQFALIGYLALIGHLALFGNMAVIGCVTYKEIRRGRPCEAAGRPAHTCQGHADLET